MIRHVPRFKGAIDLFESNAYLKMFGLTFAVFVVTLFDLGVVLAENPPGFFGWIFGVFCGALWAMWLVLFHGFLTRNEAMS